jgi:hypothetical protein
MKKFLTVIALTFIFVQVVVYTETAADPGIRTERVKFAKGATSAVIKGQVKGSGDVDYLVRAGAGQTITVSLKVSNRMNYFNVLPPGSKDVAMYAGQTGEDFKGVLPADGDYTIRIYLVRAAARRNESSKYTLTVSVTGKALEPVAASKDAVIAGTPFHASAKIACVPYIEKFRDKKPQECEAFVVRRGFEGTATVQIPQDPMTFSRKDDLTIVVFDADERYEIPDAFIFGG